MVLLPQPLGDDFDHDVRLKPIFCSDRLLLLLLLLLHLNREDDGRRSERSHVQECEAAVSTSMISSRADFLFFSALESELASFLLVDAAALRALAPRAGLQEVQNIVRRKSPQPCYIITY